MNVQSAAQPQEIMQSRFYMWRAVLALAHADGIVTEEEKAFVDNYLQHVPFSDEQKKMIREDLETAQPINAMLIGIEDPADMSDFFQFAQALLWCDGDYDRQEQLIIERLTAEQMNRFNKAEISRQIQETRHAAALRRAVEDKEYRRQAKETGVLASIRRAVSDGEYRKQAAEVMRVTAEEIKADLDEKKTVSEEDKKSLQAAVAWMRDDIFTPPDDDTFNLWRALFSLVHADGKVTEEEKGYIGGMKEVFNFSDEQKQVVASDLESGADTAVLFGALKDADHRREFFATARTVVWCDGEFHQAEQDLIKTLYAQLSPEEQKAFKDDLDWVEQPPAMPEDTKTETIMQVIVRNMFGFYERNAA